MAVTKNWVTDTDAPTRPTCTRWFTGGDAASWCKHSAPGRYRSVSITNEGTGDLFVSIDPALTGARSAGQNAERIPSGQGRVYSFAGQAFVNPDTTEFSTWGADGAAHPIGIVFSVE